MAGSWFVLLAQGTDGGGGLSALTPAIPFLVIGMLFYILLIRPERRKRQELDRMLDSLNKNDHIVTIGGIWGVVVNTSKGNEFITIRVDDQNDTKLKILRSSVARVLSEDKDKVEKPKDAST